MQDDSALPIKAVIFDWGETLGPVVSERGIAAMRREDVFGQDVLAAATKHLLGGPDPGLAELAQPGWEPPAQAWRETTAGELLRTAHRIAGRPWPADPVQQRALVLRQHIYLLAAMRAAPGAADVLAALHDQELRLGLVSNAFWGVDVIRAMLDRDGLLPHLDVVLCSSAVGVRKPHPAIYRAALANLRVAPAETVFIGDRLLEDVAGPRRLGMQAILTRQFRQETPATTGLARPDAIIRALPRTPGAAAQLDRKTSASVYVKTSHRMRIQTR